MTYQTAEYAGLIHVIDTSATGFNVVFCVQRLTNICFVPFYVYEPSRAPTCLFCIAWWVS